MRANELLLNDLSAHALQHVDEVETFE